MSDSLIIQYMGFKAKRLIREYTFSVRGAGEEREFRLNITNESFVSHRASYQDAPGICSARLHAELTAFSDHPSETKFDITDAELDSYRQSRYPKARQNPWGQKKREDF
jgi:hypothetical protein